VDRLQTIFEEHDAVATIFIYCNYKEQAEQTVSNLVASPLKQIIQDRGTILDDVRSFYQHHRRRPTRPTLDQLTVVMGYWDERKGIAWKVTDIHIG
jgi:hypothetical protein